MIYTMYNIMLKYSNQCLLHSKGWQVLCVVFEGAKIVLNHKGIQYKLLEKFSPLVTIIKQ